MRRRYSDEERAAALAALKANDGNLDRTAQQVGVPRTTLQEWAAAPDRAAPPEVRQQKTEQLAELLERVARETLETMSTKRDGADYKDLAVGFGILHDKMRLTQGKPTAISETRSLDLSKLSPEEIDTFEQLYNRAAGL